MPCVFRELILVLEIRLVEETHGNSRPSKAEEFESTRLLDEDVIHFDLMSKNALSQPFGAKNV